MLITETSNPSAAGPGTGITPAPDISLGRGSIVLGTDGQPSANGAVRVARLLAERNNTPLHVVGVMDDATLASAAMDRISGEGESNLAKELRAEIGKQLHVHGIRTESIVVDIAIGSPDVALSDIAKQGNGTLLVVGTSSRGLLCRWLGLSTALGAARRATGPVLAVPPSASTLPRVAVVGTDFGQASLVATRAVLGCLDATGVLHLAHVRRVVAPIGVGAISADAAYEAELADRLQSVTESLHAPTGMKVEQHILVGNPAHRLLELARRKSADLIAVGTCGSGRLAASMMGSTASRLLRSGAMSVLLAGPPVASESPDPGQEGPDKSLGSHR